MKQIYIAKDFSIYPGGRFREDGPHSGQEFREEFLVPALKTRTQVEIIFDGTRGYGSSFLEEAFGGLIRKGFSLKEVTTTLTLTSSDDDLIKEIEYYLKKAATA